MCQQIPGTPSNSFKKIKTFVWIRIIIISTIPLVSLPLNFYLIYSIQMHCNFWWLLISWDGYIIDKSMFVVHISIACLFFLAEQIRWMQIRKFVMRQTNETPLVKFKWTAFSKKEPVHISYCQINYVIIIYKRGWVRITLKKGICFVPCWKFIKLCIKIRTTFFMQKNKFPNKLKMAIAGLAWFLSALRVPNSLLRPINHMMSQQRYRIINFISTLFSIVIKYEILSAQY